MPEQAYKRCDTCRTDKPLSDYGPSRRSKDGHKAKCIACVKEAASIRRRNRRLADPQHEEVINQRSRKRHPEKARARSIVSTAVWRGTITKPEECERCHGPYSGRELDGHHRDYSKPLEVEWLCRDCHVAVHAEEKEQQSTTGKKRGGQ